MNKQKKFAKQIEDYLTLEVLYCGDSYRIADKEQVLGACLVDIANFDYKALERILRELEAMEKSLRKGNDLRVVMDIQRCVNKILDSLSDSEPYKSIINRQHYDMLANTYDKSRLSQGKVNSKDREIIRALCGRLYTICSELIYARFALVEFLNACEKIEKDQTTVAGAFAKLKADLSNSKQLKSLVGRSSRAYKLPENNLDFKIDVDFAVPSSGNEILGERITFTSLRVFVYWEAGKSIVNGTQVRRCKYCDRAYATAKGYAYEYCDEIAPGESERTCRQIGAQRIHNEKVRNDPIWAVYRRVYKKYHARVRKNTMAREEFQRWIEMAKEARELAFSGALSETEFSARLDETLI